MKPPKSLELPQSKEGGKRFGDDSHRNYMARKIDMQRKQFGLVLPPAPAVIQRKADAGYQETNYLLGDNATTEMVTKLSKKRKTERVRFSDDVVDRPSRPAQRNKRGGMSSMLKRLKQKHGKKKKSSHSEAKRELSQWKPEKIGDEGVKTDAGLLPKDNDIPSTSRLENSDKLKLKNGLSIIDTIYDTESNSCRELAPVLEGEKSCFTIEEDLEKEYAAPAEIPTRKERLDLFFLGVVVLVNGYTDPDAASIQRILQRHGGDLEKYETSRITHIIAEHLSTAKANIYKRQRKPTPVCRPQWILDCVKSERLLPHASYLLEEVRDENVGKKSVKSFFAPPDMNIHAITSQAQQESGGLYLNGECLENPTCYAKIEGNEKGAQESLATALLAQVNEAADSNISEEIENEPGGIKNIEETKAQQGISKGFVNETGKVRTVGTDPNFLNSYFSSSRLSFIGSFKQRIRLSPTKKEPQSHKISDCRLVFHVDMDCFFVAVALRNYPEHRDKPVAISHQGKNNTKSGSTNSTSECATCNYEARKFGVKKGMFLGRARELCADLVVLSYDFEGYEEVSGQVSEILYSQAERFHGNVEQVSCDESYVEIFVPASVQERSIAEQIREEIYAATQCTASVGVGINKLLAKLATDEAKPDGYFVVQNYRELLERLNLRDLPGVGYRMECKLQAEGLTTVRDVWQLGGEAEGQLCRILGPGLGRKILHSCEGEDERPVKPAARKTIGAECNYGVRFDGPYGVDYMMKGLAKEVQKRMEGVGVRGSRITLKVKQRKEGSKPPGKFLGHGSCHNLSKSSDTAVTRDWEVFSRAGMVLFEELRVLPDDVRGMGVVVSKLAYTNRYENEASSSRGITRFFRAGTSNGGEVDESVVHLDDGDLVGRSPVTNLVAEEFALESQEDDRKLPSRSAVTFATTVQYRKCEEDRVTTDYDAALNRTCNLSAAWGTARISNNANATSFFPPTFSQIDKEVLDELPLSIREEILREAGSSSTSMMANSANSISSNHSSTEVKMAALDNDQESASLVEEHVEKDTHTEIVDYSNFSVEDGQVSQGENDVALPPLSQIHMSQVMALPSPLRKHVVSKMRSSPEHNIQIAGPTSPIMKTMRPGTRRNIPRRSLDTTRRGRFLSGDNSSTLKQANVKRLLKLASIKTGKETLSDSFGGESVSLTQLEYLPLEVQLQVANNDACSVGFYRKKTSAKNNQSNGPIETAELALEEAVECVNFTETTALSNTSAIDPERDGFHEEQPFSSRSFYRDNVVPLRQWMDSHADPSDENIAFVNDFLCICINEYRVEDAITLLRSVRNRNDLWKTRAYKNMVRAVVEGARTQLGGTLDIEWLGL